LCYVTGSEHVCLPTIEDVKEGVIAAKIAAHVADVVKGIDVEQDAAMARARKELNWEKQFELAIDPEKARELRRKRPPLLDPNVCAMCGKFCAIKMVDDYLKKK
jgi:phosphomethylpyrimidine synthase